MRLFPMGWHHTYSIQRRGHWCISCFQAKPRYKHALYQLHAGELRTSFGGVIKTDVIVFPASLALSAADHAKKLSAELRQVEKMLDQLPDLKRSVAVVPTWIRRVESVEYFPGQRKTVEKEDIVLVQELAEHEAEGSEVEYSEASGEDISLFRHEHPALADLVESSRRHSGGRRVISCVRAVWVDGVYRLTFVAFRCCHEARETSRSRQVTPSEPEPSTSHTPLVPTAPVPEVLEPTAPEGSEPTAPHPLEPTAPQLEEEVSSETGSEEEGPPPPYGECVPSSRTEGIPAPPPYQHYEDAPPPYETVARSVIAIPAT